MVDLMVQFMVVDLVDLFKEVIIHTLIDKIL
jgi:hypothetical protein